MALKDFKLTPSGDLELNTLAQPTPIYGRDAITQLVGASLSLWLGNWFRDPTRGVDWLNVMKLAYSRAEIINILTRALNKVPYIDEVVDISIKVNNETREATLTYTIKALGAPITGSEVL